MNANKKNSINSSMNSGWILCPSKTFPGKFYYFNVINGEAAWSIDDAEVNMTSNLVVIPTFFSSVRVECLF